MKTTWIQPVIDEAPKWIATAVIGGVNELGKDGLTRLDGATGILQATIDRVRGAIGNGARVRLSLTPNTIPAEARRNFWVLVIYDLVNSTPQMGEYSLKNGFEKMRDDAEKWLQAVSKGEQIVSSPTDPDPTSQIGIVWGDSLGVNTPNQTAVDGQAGVSVAIPETTPGKEDMTVH